MRWAIASSACAWPTTRCSSRSFSDEDGVDLVGHHLADRDAGPARDDLGDGLRVDADLHQRRLALQRAAARASAGRARRAAAVRVDVGGSAAVARRSPRRRAAAGVAAGPPRPALAAFAGRGLLFELARGCRESSGSAPSPAPSALRARRARFCVCSRASSQRPRAARRAPRRRDLLALEHRRSRGRSRRAGGGSPRAAGHRRLADRDAARRPCRAR